MPSRTGKPLPRRAVLALPLGITLSLRAERSPAREAASEPALVRHELALSGDPKLARRALLLEPTRQRERSRRRLLVLLHGLGETGNEALGLRAWPELYGLVDNYERLLRPPLRPSSKRSYLSDERAHELNRALSSTPFAGFAVLCPITPNPQRAGGTRALDRYGDWLESVAIPAAWQRLGGKPEGALVALDGCSLGGYVALEVFLRKPELFGTLGGVQSAFSAQAAPRYAKRLAEAMQRVGRRPLHLETSTEDPYREANQRLAARLTELGVANELSVLPGPHTQPWLREVGTLEMLLFHDRNLGVLA